VCPEITVTSDDAAKKEMLPQNLWNSTPQGRLISKEDGRPGSAGQPQFHMQEAKSKKASQSVTGLLGIQCRDNLSISLENNSEAGTAPPILQQTNGLAPAIKKSRSMPGFRSNRSNQDDSCESSKSEMSGSCGRYLAATVCSSMLLSQRRRGYTGYNNENVKSNLIPEFSEDIYHKWQNNLVRFALSRIDEIPEELEEVFSQKVTDVSDQVEDSISEMQDLIQNAQPTGADRAVQKLQDVPQIVTSCVEARLTNASQELRDCVTAAIKDIYNKQKTQGDITRQLRGIPEEVQQIADRAIELAVKDSQLELRKLIEVAVASISGCQALKENQLWQVSSKAVAQVPHLLVSTGQDIRITAENKIETAVQDIQFEHVPNEVVVEALLRAKFSPNVELNQLSKVKDSQKPKEDKVKVGAKSKQTKPLPAPLPAAMSHDNVQRSAHDPLTPQNPGSFGHPEMCTRPCLFFAADQCRNFESCDFCHFAHERRPTHVDKRNRELLKSLSPDELLATTLPILRDKALKYGNKSELMELLDKAETRVNEYQAEAGPWLETMSVATSRTRTRGERALKSALRAVTLRSLLTMMMRMLPEEHAVRTIMGDVMENIGRTLRRPSSAEAFVTE